MTPRSDTKTAKPWFFDQLNIFIYLYILGCFYLSPRLYGSCSPRSARRGSRRRLIGLHRQLSSKVDQPARGADDPIYKAVQTNVVYQKAIYSSTTIKIWQFFDRSALPADLQSESPNPKAWTVQPDALFQDLQCPINKIFRDHVLIINTSLCGDWAGNTYGASTCPGISCNAFVSNNPEAFRDAYWAIRSLRIYQR